MLGGGITGVCAALELAERGVEVDLYEQASQVVSRASYWNEGKVHLGFVYAQDRSRKTARTMVEGALRFRPLLERWIEGAVLDGATSDPFIYAVHRDTIVALPAVESHFRAVADLCSELNGRPGAGYVVPLKGSLWERHEPRVTGSLFDSDEIIASYGTLEHSIDPFVVARHLRSAVAAVPTVQTILNTTIVGISRGKGGKYSVVTEGGESPGRERYDTVVNALWQNRIGIDATAGVVDRRPVLHRFKYGLHSAGILPPAGFPTVTFVLGPFGDTVNFGHRAYLSWYPAGHVHTSDEMMPSMPDRRFLESDTRQVESESLSALGRLMPTHDAWLRSSAGRWDAGGGYITAWGETGIEDEKSQLHERFEVGVHSVGGHHSVDTGKYTLGPYFAELVAERVRPAAPVHPVRQSTW
jgi:glycine/D-amino acid oxidase-like deaminating enzyme